VQTASPSNDGQPTSHPHLLPALTALMLSAVAIVIWEGHAREIERRAVHGLSVRPIKQTALGAALQREALRHSDLLPIYGASELIPSAFDRNYHGIQIFRNSPTGFALFPVGRDGSACLSYVQRLAALGADLRDKKVVISLSTPGWFFDRLMIAPASYANNFSALQACELTFSSDLSFGLRQGAARRMLQYPATLAKQPLLRFGLEQLADGSPFARAAYYAVLPLGKLETVILRLQDHRETLKELEAGSSTQIELPRSDYRAPLDWKALAERAGGDYARMSNNNPFGFANPLWINEFRQQAGDKNTLRKDPNFLVGLTNSREWEDLSLLLRELRELGARPLLLSAPIHQGWYRSRGYSAQALARFYHNLRTMADQYEVPLCDFADFGEDKLFLRDYWGHLSGEGWVNYAQVLDAFYHDSLPRPLWVSDEVIGVLDATGSVTAIHGWVYDPLQPNMPLRVEFYADEVLLGSTVADVHRDGLRQRGLGNGDHGFVFDIPERARDGKSHRVRLRLAGTSREVDGSPRTLIFARTVPPPAAPSTAVPLGVFDSRGQVSSLRGWAYDPARPDEPLRVQIFAGETLVNTVVADIRREGLAKRGIGKGLHGFSVPYPPSLRDGKPHSFRVVIAGTKVELEGSPQVLTYAPPAR
jgi:D-alanine transfer protein